MRRVVATPRPRFPCQLDSIFICLVKDCFLSRSSHLVRGQLGTFGSHSGGTVTSVTPGLRNYVSSY